MKKSNLVAKIILGILAFFGFFTVISNYGAIKVFSKASADEELWVRIMTNSMPLVFMIIGMIIFVIGTCGLAYIIIKEKNIQGLIKEGNIIKAKIEKIEKNENIEVNGEKPYKIICSWTNPEDGEKHEFISENLYGDVPEIIREKGIEELPVYVSKKNKNIYHVDCTKIS